MVEARVTEFVGDLEHDVAESRRLYPPGNIDNSSAHRRLIRKDLILALIVAAEDYHCALMVTPFDHSPDTPHIRVAQRAIMVESRIERAFVARHTTLQIQ